MDVCKLSKAEADRCQQRICGRSYREFESFGVSGWLQKKAKKLKERTIQYVKIGTQANRICAG
jgi:hypothetical protein